MQNDLLPNFNSIQAENIEHELDQLLAANRTEISNLLTKIKTPTWDNFVEPLTMLEIRLHHFWSPISHLHAVRQSPTLRAAYHACLPKLTAYHTELEQNETLYQMVVALAESDQYQQLDYAQKKVIENELRDFRLAGVHLPAAEKKRYAEIQARLAKLTTHFEENLLDATAEWSLPVQHAEELAGIPTHTLTAAQDAAQAKGIVGWLLTLHFPCYYSVITHAQNRTLREKMYSAYVTRASDYSSNKNLDNSAVMIEILQLRHELSHLLGFQNYAELSLATKMVKSPQKVLDFLHELVGYARNKAQEELAELTAYAQQLDGITQLQAWDIAYYSEKLREQKYGVSDEILRPYFPINQVLQGMFELIERLYNMQVREITNIDTWHPDVRFFAIYDEDGHLRGEFYLDLYARENKREGAWMDECRERHRLRDGTIQTPIAYLTCNLTPPDQEHPALLTHEEVLTLFHEFGHGLQHMLTQIDYAGVSGINGVAWDAVELPSQFMEFFLWEKHVLEFVSAHYQQINPLPSELYEKMLAAKNFQNALHILRQLEFALFDFRLHLEYSSEKGAGQIQQMLDEVRKQISVIPVPPFNRFQHGFSHIFAGGYAAGYYSYLWAEILASDAFAKFKEHGVLDATTGHEFLKTILEQGGAREPMELFTAFRGREPTLAAFLEQCGL